jgi:hypothetical protein
MPESNTILTISGPDRIYHNPFGNFIELTTVGGPFQALTELDGVNSVNLAGVKIVVESIDARNDSQLI